MRLLDLFCGAGGCSVGYARAGFDVTGVDLEPQPNYPYTFHQADALTYPLDGYDVIHASPPCQAYLNLTAVNRSLGRPDGHLDLIVATRDRLRSTSRPFVMENVEGSPLDNPLRICGTGLGLPLRRHRLFESNVYIFSIACAHYRYRNPRYWTGWRPNGEHRLSTVAQVYGNAGGQDDWASAMGIDWMSHAEMTQAIPPAYTEYIGLQLLAHLEAAA